MTIKQHGGIFGRNPTFNEIGGTLTTAAQPNITSLGTQTENLAFANSKGIDFSATAGTGTSELFDDYEEGDWTPTLTTDGTQFTSVSYNAGTSGKYTKIGNRVCISGRLITSGITVGSASGNLQISGLPFSGTSAAITFADTRLWSANTPSEGYLVSGTTITLRYKATSDGDSAACPYTAAGTGAVANVLTFAGVYLIS